MMNGIELDSRVKELIDRLKSIYEKYSKAFVAARTATSSSSTAVLAVAPNVHARQEDDFYAHLKSRPVGHA
jgi:hypothetical protein